MPRQQRSVDERLAAAQAKRIKLDAQMKQLEQRRKLLDVRKRAKGEKAILRVLLELALTDEMRLTLSSAIANADLKPDERDAAMSILVVGEKVEASA